jgi:hypothetical protein
MRIGVGGLIIGIVVAVALIAATGFGLLQLGRSAGSEPVENISTFQGLTDGEKEAYAKGRNDVFPYSSGPVWLEDQERSPVKSTGGTLKHFQTNDMVRAQEHIPFTIVFPTYLPTVSSSPNIMGPLGVLADEGVEVSIQYATLVLNQPGMILLTESTFVRSFGDPSLDPSLELADIGGKQVIKSKDQSSQELEHAYFFDSKGIYFFIEMHGVPTDQAIKVIGSLIQQIK